MCPLRFILVFLSTVLAGYFVWKTVHSDPDEIDPTADTDPKKETREFNFSKDGFRGFVDIASGRYRWRNFKEMRAAQEKGKSC